MTIPWKTVVTLAALSGLWWLLSGGQVASWLIGLPVVVAAAWAVGRLNADQAKSVSLAGGLIFAVYFLRESIRGGIDVALRTLAPRMRIQPGFTVYHTQLKRREARVLFANCVSLLPGTLAADLNGDRLDVHLLNANVEAEEALVRLERAVSRLSPEAN